MKLLRFACRNISSSVASRSSHPNLPISKYSIKDIQKLYHAKVPLTAVTAHDYITGKWANQSNSEIVLIGDSLAMVSLGHPSTNQLELDEFTYLAKAVSRAVTSKYLVADLPFGSFESSVAKAIDTCVSFLKACPELQALKIEGGIEYLPLYRRLNDIGVSVVAHVGLTPQRHSFLGGYKLQASKSVGEGLKLFQDCLTLQNEGKVKMILLECIPSMLAKLITENLSIPTIGIGAGKYCSGQILVMADLLGMGDYKTGKFVKAQNKFFDQAVESINQYSVEVKDSSFPDCEHSYKINQQVYEELELKIQSLKR